MKYFLFLLSVSGLLFACDPDGNISAEGYLIGEWKVDNQTIYFYNDTSAMVLSKLKDGGTDTMLMYYNFQPDSLPVQLDMNVYEGKLKGMNLFGIIDRIDRDTFLMASRMGFEGQGNKYRPKNFESTKIVTYVRAK
ncbi:MAG: hypothetical protein AAF849_21910 [Bacteroidota bacterium]